jgi:hypothetical protein
MWRSGDTAPRIYNLDTIWGVCGSLHVAATLPPGGKKRSGAIAGLETLKKKKSLGLARYRKIPRLSNPQCNHYILYFIALMKEY